MRECKFCSAPFKPSKKNHVCCSKECTTKLYKQKNKEREKATKRDYALRMAYGISAQEWDEMFERQGRRCAICKEPTAERWATDHDHDTGKVRGILCSTCNLGLGYFKDNLDNLHEAAVYLAASRNLIREYYAQ